MSGGVAFLSWLGQAAVVVVGWVVVHRLSVQRDVEKAKRETLAKAIDSAVGDLNKLLIAARDYHTKDRDVGVELGLKIDLQDATMQTVTWTSLSDKNEAIARCRSQIGAVRRAITRDHFEDEHVGPLAESDEQLQAIAESVLTAKRGLLELKHSQIAA